jgi:predicted NACHT family NTPase
MSLDDLDAFIDHWHSAIVVGRDPSQLHAAGEESAALKRRIRRQSALRRLATSPLLCAMLCALHHDGNTELPQDRIELYERALEAMLQRRDAERRVTADQPILSARKKQQLLQELAYWLVRNKYSYAPVQQAINQLRRSLTRIAPDEQAERVFQALLLRTGLLREPVPGHVDFVHRTFLEYLAARAIVADDDIGMLVDNAHADTYEEIVVLAAGLANRQQCRNLIEGLLARAKVKPRGKHRLRLLAVACLETVVDMEEDLGRELEVVLRDLVPPQTLIAARHLASAGDLAVPLLGPPVVGRLRAGEARACVRALGHIGTDLALDQLERFSSDDRITVARELVGVQSVGC